MLTNQPTDQRTDGRTKPLKSDSESKNEEIKKLRHKTYIEKKEKGNVTYYFVLSCFSIMNKRIQNLEQRRFKQFMNMTRCYSCIWRGIFMIYYEKKTVNNEMKCFIE